MWISRNRVSFSEVLPLEASENLANSRWDLFSSMLKYSYSQVLFLKKMDQWATFCLFSSFPNHSQILNWKSIDVVFGIWIPDRRVFRCRHFLWAMASTQARLYLLWNHKCPSWVSSVLLKFNLNEDDILSWFYQINREIWRASKRFHVATDARSRRQRCWWCETKLLPIFNGPSSASFLFTFILFKQ